MEEYKTEHEYKVLRVNNQTKKSITKDYKKALKGNVKGNTMDKSELAYFENYLKNIIHTTRKYY